MRIIFWGHDTTSGPDNERKRGDIEKEKVPSLLRRVSGKNDGLDSDTRGNGLIGVDALVGPFLAVEEVGVSLTIRGIRVEPPKRMRCDLGRGGSRGSQRFYS